jgi:hypothetical protein
MKHNFKIDLIKIQHKTYTVKWCDMVIQNYQVIY